MGLVLKEADIAPETKFLNVSIVSYLDFAIKVFENQMPTIDHECYRTSHQNIKALIKRLMILRATAMKKRNMDTWESLNAKIIKLRQINSDLQKALETY